MSFVLCTEAATGEVLLRKGVLRNFAKFTGKHLCHFIKIDTLAQVFSCEFCEISKNTIFTEHLRPTASLICSNLLDIRWKLQRRSASLQGPFYFIGKLMKLIQSTFTCSMLAIEPLEQCVNMLKVNTLSQCLYC